MNSTTEKRIALISVHVDPAIEIGKEEAGGQNVYVRHVGEALAQLGWQVDMFTRKVSLEQDSIVQHSDNCRTIRLKAGPVEFVLRDNLFGYLPEFVENLLTFQIKNSITYPLVHTNYWLSSWVGMQLKAIQGSKQIHTYHSLGAVKYNTIKTIPLIASQRLEVEKQVLETAECIVATSPQEKRDIRSLISTRGNIDIISTFSWDDVANKLNELYTQLLREEPISNSVKQQRQPVAQKLKTFDFDVFLCHNSRDKPFIIKIADALEERKIKPWIDKNNISPGEEFQAAIEQAIPKIKCAAIFFGSHGTGKWQKEEIKALYRQKVEKEEEKIILIPILLQGVDEIPSEYLFLRGHNYLKLKSQEIHGQFLNELVKGVKRLHD